MGVAKELVRAQLGIKLNGCWYRALTIMHGDDVVLVADSVVEEWVLVQGADNYA